MTCLYFSSFLLPQTSHSLECNRLTGNPRRQTGKSTHLSGTLAPGPQFSL
uniref:Uncharacterized protein n=1 Tax=Rhizophora mucronata TaxID=61149 RepID=A0A2P2PJD2_RHIMU